MSFEPIYEVATTDSPEKICSGQVVVEAKLFAPPGITISKILSVAASVNITASEVFAGEVRYSGKVNYRVIILGSEGETECPECSADFSDKLPDDDIDRSMSPVFDYYILDTDITNVGNGEIRLATVVEVNLIKPRRKRFKYLKFGGEGIFTQTEELNVPKECGFNTQKVNVSDSRPVTAQKLLGDHCRVIVTKKSCSEGFVATEGKIIADFCLGNGEDISSVTVVTPFSAEIALEGCTSECAPFVRAFVTETKAQIRNDENGAILESDYVVSVTAIAYGAQKTQVVCDAFSTNCELNATAESMEIRRLCDCFTAEDCVTGTVTLDAANPVADSVMAVCSPSVHITSAFVKDESPIAEGVINAVILYYSAELNSRNSVSVELPFSLKLNHRIEDDREIDLRAVVSDFSVKVRRNGEFDVRAELIFEGDVYETEVESVITELEEGDETAPSDAAITVHYARGGERLFDVAKALKCAPECIVSQNPSAEYPLKRGQTITLFRHIER